MSVTMYNGYKVSAPVVGDNSAIVATIQRLFVGIYVYLIS